MLSHFVGGERRKRLVPIRKTASWAPMPFDKAHDKPGNPAAWETSSSPGLSQDEGSIETPPLLTFG